VAVVALEYMCDRAEVPVTAYDLDEVATAGTYGLGRGPDQGTEIRPYM